MYEPKPYGLAVYGNELTEDDRNFIDSCCKKMANFKQVSQLDSLKYTRDLPDGGFVIVQDAGGIFRAIAYKPDTLQEKQVFDGYAKIQVPMLFSGVINTGLDTILGLEVSLTQMTERRMGQYITPLGASHLKRLSVTYGPGMKALMVPQAIQNLPGAERFTQYHRLKSTWYSGAMAEVVQIVSGFGRQDFDNLPDLPAERVQMILPEKVIQQIASELGEQMLLPGYSGVPHVDGSIQYSFIFNNTHLISFDEHGAPWLIQVQASGVWAMPLPMIQATTTAAFLEYIRDVGDHEIEKIVARFGGIPSGENFPQGADFYRWVRAGVIIRICDTGNFHNHSPYTSACGWSSNLDGTNLINTCYDYLGDHCYGYTYQISLSLGSVKDRGLLKRRSTQNLSTEQSKQVGQYLSALFVELDQDETLKHSIMYKIRRIEVSEILARTGNDGAQDVEYWDNYECTPIASHTGRCSITNQGPLYGGLKLKLPEPVFEGCISMDFSPRKGGENAERVDTIAFAYYIGDDLKVIKCFYDARKSYKEVRGNFTDTMVVGSWEQVEYQGLTGLAGELYSTDFDHRQEIAPTEVTTKIEGRDLGYGQPLASFIFYFWTDGTLSRSRYYSHYTQAQYVTGRSINEAFLIPFFSRNSAIYVERESIPGTRNEIEMERLSVRDPNSYEFWTYDASWHSFDNGLKKTGKPFPVDSVPVWAETHQVDRSDPRSDFADEGDWIGGLPADITHLVHPPGGINLISYGGAAPPFETYQETTGTPASKKNAMHLSMMDRPMKLHDRSHDDWFYSRSPDGFRNVFYVDMCKVVFGEMKYGNISIDNEAGKRYRFGYSRLANNEHAHTFIGVINE